MIVNPRSKKVLYISILLLLAGFFFLRQNKAIAPTEQKTNISNIPLEGAKDRVTKKPFGILISKATSPVQPEKFGGYHTGADFETFADEQNKDIQVRAICEGDLILKKTATGYGGVAVQACNLNEQPVTVIYGHLKLSSIKTEGLLKKGDVIGILGKGYSSETDGERKHLHLGIHKGTTINILGYVQKQDDLKNWINPLDFLQ
ncbi:MAG: peptidoglycan DD-metalloendopeptidase family protein [Candidatus Doudnabacteria bacterium]